MPSFNNSIPRTGLQQFRKGSSLRSPRDADATPRAWQKSAKVEQQLAWMGQNVEQLQNQVNLLLSRYKRNRGGGGVAVQHYRLQHVRGDYLVCRAYDPVSNEQEADDVLIAKPPKLRRSIESAVIDGDTVNYTYNSDIERVATRGAAVETQVIVPRYIEAVVTTEEVAPGEVVITEVTPGDIIIAVEVATGITAEEEDGGGTVDWLDINVDARAWAQK